MMKGSGGGYGFDAITEFGATLEAAAKNANVAVVSDTLTALAEFLDTVEVVFE
jgi:hypothetical protein